MLVDQNEWYEEIFYDNEISCDGNSHDDGNSHGHDHEHEHSHAHAEVHSHVVTETIDYGDHQNIVEKKYVGSGETKKKVIGGRRISIRGQNLLAKSPNLGGKIPKRRDSMPTLSPQRRDSTTSLPGQDRILKSCDLLSGRGGGSSTFTKFHRTNTTSPNTENLRRGSVDSNLSSDQNSFYRGHNTKKLSGFSPSKEPVINSISDPTPVINHFNENKEFVLNLVEDNSVSSEEKAEKYTLKELEEIAEEDIISG